MHSPDLAARLHMAARAFSPGAPVDKYALFAGRTSEVREVVNAINQRGQHVILFGERGVGKTSLANVLSEVITFGGARAPTAIINCDGSDTFSSLWRKVFREIPVEVSAGGFAQLGFGAPDIKPTEVVTLDRFLDDNFGPEDVRYRLHSLGRDILIIVDELDRITNRDTTRLLADTIKSLSDHSTRATVILVGVADSVDELVEQHQSIERALVQVRMPRMSLDELLEIMDRGLQKLVMTIEDDAKVEIAELSQGLPHYTHLLGLHASQEAIQDGSNEVRASHVEKALDKAVGKAQQSIRSVYHRATSSPRPDNLFGKVLLACALAPTDDLGYFAAADLRRPLSIIANKQYDIPAYSQHLNDFCEPKRGPVLQKVGSPRKYRFRFINPMMQPFVVMHGRAKGLINGDVLRAISGKAAPSVRAMS